MNRLIMNDLSMRNTRIKKGNFGCVFLALLLGANIHLPAQQLLSDRIPLLKTYDADHLLQVALPLGGIGTGTVSLGGRGELRDWEIMNVPAKGFSTVTDGNDAPFFAIYAKLEGGGAITKGLLGPLYDSEYQHAEGRSVNHHGLPRFREASFETTYPFGIVNLADSLFPATVKIVGYNPFIPGDSDASGIPLAVFEMEVHNPSGQAMEVAIAGSLRNFIGKDGRDYKTDWKGDYIPLGAQNNENTYRTADGISGIFMHSNGVDSLHPAWGTMALATSAPADQVSYRTSSAPNAWSRGILDFWDDFSADGTLTEKTISADPDPMASLAVRQVVPAGQTKVFRFYLTWHFPNRQSWGSWSEVQPTVRVGNYYTTQYDDAWAVIRQILPRLEKLTDKTLAFVRAFAESDYSPVLKEAALFNLSTLRSQTVFRTEGGKMFGWEGVFDRFGSCFGSCTHVWNYEQATAFTFADLARSMREVEFGHATHDNGFMSFRVNLPLDSAQLYPKAAADGQMGTIMKFYREWQLSGDDAFLQKHWPQVKSAFTFAWVKGGWDGDQDGVMEGVQHNTMDVEYFGPNPQMQFWYLGALKAMQKMAEHLGEDELANICQTLFTKGSRWTDENLFNGEYYIQQLQVPASMDEIANGLMAGMGSEDLQNPQYQLEEGCLIDQLVGQYMAHVLGLGYLGKPENMRKTLQSILKYNQRKTLFEHFNNMRSYALGDEKALLMVSYPKGGRPEVPFPYWSEVMTGFEYTAAVGMLYEGLETEGLEVIRNIRDRYDGSKRNPFDEAECGHHYTRAMASWAGILAQSGFKFSAVEQSMQFHPKTGKWFWSNGSAWGTCHISKENGDWVVDLMVLHGAFSLKSFQLGEDLQKHYNEVQTVGEGNRLTFELNTK